MRREVGSQDQGEDRVDVHGELDRGEVEAGQEGEDAVEAGNFVEEEGERDEAGACGEIHKTEEFLGGVC